MADTPDEIYKIQLDIFLKKPLKERFFLNLELTEFVREMTKRRILSENPGISEKKLKKEIFKEYYSDIFSKKEIKNITSKL